MKTPQGLTVCVSLRLPITSLTEFSLPFNIQKLGFGLGLFYTKVRVQRRVSSKQQQCTTGGGVGGGQSFAKAVAASTLTAWACFAVWLFGNLWQQRLQKIHHQILCLHQPPPPFKSLCSSVQGGADVPSNPPWLLQILHHTLAFLSTFTVQFNSPNSSHTICLFFKHQKGKFCSKNGRAYFWIEN